MNFKRVTTVFLSLLIASTLSSGIAQAQTPAPIAVAPIAVMAPGQLDSLVSPIALYPDPLLSQVLVASTFPLQVVQAAQWLQQNNTMTGTALQDAARQQNWDPSVQALVVFPDVLQRMSANIQWTTDLGNAFVAQQSGVMDSVQRLRSQAVASSNLKTNPQEVVTTGTENGAPVVQIEPANPQVIYVPTYDPYSIWGPAYYPYPSLFYPRFGAGLYFGRGIFVGSFFAGFGGWGGWGWRPNWGGRTVIVNNTFVNRYGFGRAGIAGRAPVSSFRGPAVIGSRSVGRVSTPMAAPRFSRPVSGGAYRTAAPAVSRGAYRAPAVSGGAYRTSSVPAASGRVSVAPSRSFVSSAPRMSGPSMSSSFHGFSGGGVSRGSVSRGGGGGHGRGR